MYCKNCGRENAEGSCFCSHCGTVLSLQKPQQSVQTGNRSAGSTAPKQQSDSKPGCMPLFLIVALVLAVFFIWSIGEDKKAEEEQKASVNQSSWESGSSLKIQYPAETQDPYEVYEYDDQSHLAPGTDFVYGSYEVTDHGCLVNTQLEPYTYPSGDISALDGFFRMNGDKQNCVTLGELNSYCGREILPDNGWGDHVHMGSDLPVCINRSKGEQLVVAGEAWSYRSEEERRDMMITLYPATLAGYSNAFMLSDIGLYDINSINGIDISSINEDHIAVSNTLKHTGIFSMRCISGSMNVHDYLLAAEYGTNMKCGFFEETEYFSRDVPMTHPCYKTAFMGEYIKASVQATTDGYFIIDVSDIPAGYYIIEKSIGNVCFAVE